MRNSATETGLSLLGGALLGAAVMYILDPEVGDKRRRQIRDKAGDALEGTGDVLGDVWERARDLGSDLVDRAGDLSSHLADRTRGAAGAASDAASSAASGAASAWSSLSDKAGDARDSAADQLHGLRGKLASIGYELIDRARHFGRHAADRAGDAADSARQSLRETTHPYRHALARAIDPEHEPHTAGHVVGYTSTALGTLAAGAAAMYFLDPQRGRARRHYLIDQAQHILRETGTVCRRTGQDLINRLQGTAYEASSRFRAVNPASGEQLVQRVRSELGHVISNPMQVQLMADANGAVTLYGRVPASEVDRLLSTVNNVRGVTQIVNRLDVQDLVQGGTSSTTGAGGTTGGSTGTTAGTAQSAPRL